MEQSTHEKVLYFINLIKGHKNDHGHDAHGILQNVYMRGNCYMFAKTLQFVFPQTIIYTSHSFGYHVVASIEDRLYDIRGELMADGYDRYEPITEEQEKKAMAWCYSHVNQSSYGLRDSNGNNISHLEKLELDSENNSWIIPNLQVV